MLRREGSHLHGLGGVKSPDRDYCSPLNRSSDFLRLTLRQGKPSGDGGEYE